MAFSDLQIKAASEAAIIASHRNMAKLGVFSKSWRELNGRYGNAITIPFYSLSSMSSMDFVPGVNDYGTATNEIDAVTLPLDRHIVRSACLTDKEEAFTGISWATDTAAALVDSLSRKVNEIVFGQLSSSDITLSADVSLSSKSAIANLYAVADENDIPVDEAVVVLRPTEFAKVLGELDASTFGGIEPVQLGYVPKIFGLAGLVCSTNLPSSYTVGALITRGAIATVNRYLPPATENAYAEAWSITD